MPVAETIQTYLEAQRRDVDRELDGLLPPEDTYPPSIHHAMRYSVFAGGKRLRPILCLESGRLFGGDERILRRAGSALEMIHTYSLIHDDLPCMDNDDLRRGKPTLHRVFPEWHALLTGDYLATFAFEILAACTALTDGEKIELVHILSSRAGARGMIGGQIIDLMSQGHLIDIMLLQEMHANKTAALISASLEFGAVVAHASAQDRLLIKKCGMQ